MRLDLESLIAGEYAENMFRKQFTASEMAAIGRAIEEELVKKGRRGGDPAAKPMSAIADIGRSVEIAAKRAGFKSAETFKRAKAVTEKGTPEPIAAMDAGSVSISAAAAIASQPKSEQKRIVELPKDQQREVVRHKCATKAERELNEARALDLRLYRGLWDAVKFLPDFQPDAKETWAGLQRVCAYEFQEHLRPAIRSSSALTRSRPMPNKNLKELID